MRRREGPTHQLILLARMHGEAEPRAAISERELPITGFSLAATEKKKRGSGAGVGSPAGAGCFLQHNYGAWVVRTGLPWSDTHGVRDSSMFGGPGVEEQESLSGRLAANSPLRGAKEGGVEGGEPRSRHSGGEGNTGTRCRPPGPWRACGARISGGRSGWTGLDWR